MENLLVRVLPDHTGFGRQEPHLVNGDTDSPTELATSLPARPSGADVFRCTAYHTSFCLFFPFSFNVGLLCAVAPVR
jgi:hypothetical protein